MVFMAELNRLLLFHVSAGQVGRAGNLRVNVERGSRKHRAEDHADPGYIVCTLMEKLCHRETPSNLSREATRNRRLPGFGFRNKGSQRQSVNKS
jgi:hypothetical protein